MIILTSNPTLRPQAEVFDEQDWQSIDELGPEYLSGIFHAVPQLKIQRLCAETKLLNAVFEMTVGPYVRSVGNRSTAQHPHPQSHPNHNCVRTHIHIRIHIHIHIHTHTHTNIRICILTLTLGRQGSSYVAIRGQNLGKRTGCPPPRGLEDVMA